jgi:hypothetical protein
VHVDVWKATSDIDGNAKTIKSDESLFTTDSCRLIVNVDAVPFQLGQRMDGVALPGVSILMHDENHGSTVGMGDHTSCDKSAPLHDVPVNTLNVNISVRLIVDLYDWTVIPAIPPLAPWSMRAPVASEWLLVET